VADENPFQGKGMSGFARIASLLLTVLMVVAPDRQVLAQAPGYMGKRLSITGEVSFFNALFRPDHNMASGLQRFAMNVRSTMDLDYVVARNGSIGITFDLIFSGLEFDWASDRFARPLVPGIGEDFGHAQVRGYGYGINYKVFRNPAKGGIAPLGGYTKFDLMLLDLRVRPFDRAAGVAHDFTQQFITPMVSATFGQQRVFFNVLLVRTGVQVGFVPGGIVPYFELLDGNRQGAEQLDELSTALHARMFTYYLLNFNVGVGFLAPVRKRP
jgi:hypothetical protein